MNNKTNPTQKNIFEYIDSDTSILKLVSKVKTDAITDEIQQIFDYQTYDGQVVEEIAIPKFPDNYQIGLIIGSSGSGKSTILKKAFAEEEIVKWDPSIAIASHFNSFQEASDRFGAVGLNSIPTWLKPFDALSNGEKFRADLARKLKNNASIDEFTSVVNREVAISCSCSIEKYIRKHDLHGITFCSCHDDIIPYLRPDWIYNTDTHEFYNGRYLCRPKIHIDIVSCNRKAWDMFKRFHYLSGELNQSSICFLGLYNDIPISFLSVLAFPRKGLVHAWREHRIVVLPDYQGMGVGTGMSDAIAQAFISKGCRYFSKAANPRIGEHREHSPYWRATSRNKNTRHDYFDKNGNARGNDKYRMNDEMMKYHSNRMCYSHEYIGDGTIYPYTLKKENDNMQLEISDFLDGICMR